MSKDCLQSFIFDNADIRGAIISLEDSLADMFNRQFYSPEQENLLASFSAANVLLASQLKFDGLLSLQAQATAALDLIMTECSHNLHYRGILKAKEDIAALAFSDIFAGGSLAITLLPEKGAQYQGIVPTQANSLEECLQAYFSQSEQLPTWFCFAAAEGRVRGLMLQAMPAQVCLDAEQSEENWQRVVHLASTLTEEEMLTLSHEALLYRLYHEEVLRVFEAKPVFFRCTCSTERMERGLLSLGVEELRDMIEQDNEIKTQCHFCNREYHFSKAAIMNLMQGLSMH